MNISWLEPWTPIESGRSEGLEIELSREVGPEHPLYGMEVVAVARREDQDDVLFALADGRAAVVHLTWRAAPEGDSRWPDTLFYASLAAWAEQGMAVDHAEFKQVR